MDGSERFQRIIQTIRIKGSASRAKLLDVIGASPATFPQSARMQSPIQSLHIRIKKWALILTLCTAISGCALFSGDREIPISETAKEHMNEKISPFPPNLRRAEDRSMVFVAAFDGTLNDRLHVPNGEDMTVVAKLYDSIDVTDTSAGPISKHYEKGPGCRLGFACWFDAMTGYSSEGTALTALRELQRFVSDKPSNIELRVVVLGFSRGAATARHFLNLVQDENRYGFLRAAGHATWSSALLFDTVATGQESVLNLGLPANVEFAVNYIAQHESRRLFAPVIDNDARFQAIAALKHFYSGQRIWTIQVPGSHSDIGDSYLSGAGALVAANAKAVLIRMGLVKATPIELCPDKQNSCRKLDEGLHDSRGFLDRLTGTPSPFSCRFSRKPSRVEHEEISEAEVAELVGRYRARQAIAPVFSIRTSIQTRSTESYVMEAKVDATQWPVVNPKWEGFAGYEALIREEADGPKLMLTDRINPGVKLPIPTSVFGELRRQGGEALVEFNLIKPGGPWWFVNGCLPSEG